MANILPNGKTQFLDSTGKPLAGGSVTFYAQGTSTPKNTWQDAAATILNTNPVTLDASGSAAVYGAGDYRQVVKDSLGNQVWDQNTSDGYTGLAASIASVYSSSAIMAASGGSALVGFLQSGTGAAVRTLQSKERDVVSAFDFFTSGQIADVLAGTALVDCTAAINTAITSVAITGTGGTLYFPAGLYNVAGTINVGQTSIVNNINLVGAGQDATILQCSGTVTAIKIGSAGFQSVNGSMRDLSIRNKAANVNVNGIHLNNINVWKFVRVRSTGHTGKGWFLENMCVSNYWDDCYTDSNGDVAGGFYVTGISTNNILSGGRIASNTGPGLRQTGTGVVGTILTGGIDIEANQNGGILDDSTDVEGSIIVDDGVWIESNATAVAQVIFTGGSNKRIGRAMFFAGNGYDIKIDGVINASIIDPLNQPSTTAGGIYITSTSVNTYVRIRGNKPNGQLTGNINNESSTTILDFNDNGGSANLSAGIVHHTSNQVLDGSLIGAYGGLSRSTVNGYIYSKFDTLNVTAAGTSPPTVTKDVTVGFRTQPSLKCVWPASTTNTNFYPTDYIACTLGQTVWVSFKSKADANSYGKVQASLRKSDGTFVATVLLPLTTNWQYFHLPFTVPSAGNYGVYFWLPGNLAGTLTQWVDELQYENGVTVPGPFVYTNGAAVTASAGGIFPAVYTQQLSLKQTQTTVGAAGGATALPATPTGYTVIQINGTDFVVPYYAKA